MEMPRAWTATALERRISLALLAGSLLKALAAVCAPQAMGPWDRQPMRSAGCLANYLDLHSWHFAALALGGVVPRNYRKNRKVPRARTCGDGRLRELVKREYECSGVVKNEDGTLSRGYKLATLRTLLDSAGVLTQVALSAIQVHDMALCRPVLEAAPVLRAGDLLLEDRGFLDGATVSDLKRKRRVDIIIPLKANMLATREAMQLAEMAGTWQTHPSRPDPTIALVRGVEHMWAECEVPLNACVIRYWNKKKKCTEHIVLVTTDLKLNASWIVRHYEERPEIEQDYEQMKSGGWQLKKLSSTRYSEIVFYVLTVVLSYSLYHLFANTQRGGRFADKTRQALAFEQLRTQRTHIIVYAGGHFEIFETLHFVQMVLQLSPPVQERLRSWLVEHLNQIRKRE